MLDILGAMLFGAVSVLIVGALATAATRALEDRIRFVLIATAWFVTIVGLAAAGVFSRSGPLGSAIIGAAVVGPILVGTFALATSRSFRSLALGVPITTLVGIHAARVAGVFFVMLYAAGRLPPTFALSAGLGDIFVGATALPLAWAIHRRVRGWRALTWAWTSIGLLDLVTAVTLGIGSATGSPLRFLFERPDSSAITVLPWLMIPGFLVPLLAVTHIVTFARLAAGVLDVQRQPLHRAA